MHPINVFFCTDETLISVLECVMHLCSTHNAQYDPFLRIIFTDFKKVYKKNKQIFFAEVLRAARRVLFWFSEDVSMLAINTADPQTKSTARISPYSPH
jgi:hypothetical protein